ncbi:MAG: VCBS repeat-containing protein [Nitrospirae bacterium]|nr:VCBS repeat-containing protein [Nitrospirota bacterium]
MLRKPFLILVLFFTGCANSDFPFCCEQKGDKNVPYTTTYIFNKHTGLKNTVADQSLLRIISQADLANLFNAANVSKVSGTGSVSGNLLAIFGGDISNIVLEATDADGNKIGDFFYNNLGGVPDFSNQAGTSANGGFTLLNAPPGEVYLKAVQGGRGKTSVLSYSDAVSLINIGMVKVPPPFIGVTGNVRAYQTGVNVSGALLAPAGLKGLSVFSPPAGLYRFPSLGSDSRFLIEASAAGYLPTYQEIATDLAALPQGAVDVTENIDILSMASLQDSLTQTRFTAFNPAQGVLVGVVQGLDETRRPYSAVILTDDQGTFLNMDSNGKPRIYQNGSYKDPVTGTLIPTFFWFDDPAGKKISYYDSGFNIQTYDCAMPSAKTCPSISVGITDGSYIAFNLPPGRVNLSATALEETAQGLSYFAGVEKVEIFPGSASIKKVTVRQTALGKNNFFQGLSGNVADSDGTTPIGLAAVFALGNALSLTTADPAGYFNIPLADKVFLDQASYTFKVSKPSYLDTYQDIKMDGQLKTLALYSATGLGQYLSAAGLSAQYDSSKGILAGMIVENKTGRGTDGVILQASDTSGNIVGDIRYFDSSGLPTLNQASAKNGRFIIFNLPAGPVQVRAVSQDDSGNRWIHSYSNGIVLSDIDVNNSSPPAIQVSGVTRDIDGTAIGNASLSVMGEKVRFQSASDGSFSRSFSTFSRYAVKARGPQADSLDTYSLFDTVISNMGSMTFWALTRPAIQNQVSNGPSPFTVDFSKGILSGTVASTGFSTPVPLNQFSFSSAPMPGISQQRMAEGLFDEDNEIDVAYVRDNDNKLTVLLGGGDGAFRESSGSPLITGANPVSVRSIDINGDGVLDLIVANLGSDSLTIFLGTGKGNFIPAGVPPYVPLALPSGCAPVAVSAADFNGDGKVDLVVLCSAASAYYFIPGNGDGTFSSTKYPYNTRGNLPIALLSLDFNGDGNLDLAVVNSGSNNVALFLGYGTGLFVLAPNSPYPVGAFPVGIAAGDMNGDGLADLVIPNQGSGTVSVLLGKGGGLFSQAQSPPVLLSRFPEPPEFPEFVALNDVNSDGRIDLVVTTVSGNILTLPGLGDGTFGTKTVYSVLGNPSNLLIADFNDDTYSDLLVYKKGSGSLALMPGKDVVLPNVTIEALDLDGSPVGIPRYLDASGNILPGNQTDDSGRFIIYNVSPGVKNVHAIQGASGNRFLTAYQGSATFGNISNISPRSPAIQYSGTTVDAVGDATGGGSIVRNVEGVQISVLGTGVQAFSDSASAFFNFGIDANNNMFLKLQR